MGTSGYCSQQALIRGSHVNKLGQRLGLLTPNCLSWSSILCNCFSNTSWKASVPLFVLLSRNVVTQTVVCLTSVRLIIWMTWSKSDWILVFVWLWMVCIHVSSEVEHLLQVGLSTDIWFCCVFIIKCVAVGPFVVELTEVLLCVLLPLYTRVGGTGSN